MDNIMMMLNGAWDNFFIFVIAFVLVLSLLVFVHEWGHYIVAKMCGVKITAFSIGFGPELFGFNDKSGTRWRVAAIPLGGYVQMFGDADPSSSTKSDDAKELTEEEKSVAFYHKPLWQRAAIVFAGPGINFLFAILLYLGLFVSVGQPVTPPVVSAVVMDSAAQKAGFEPYDRIVSINNTKITRFEDIQREIMVALDTKTSITFERDGESVTFDSVYPERKEIEDRFGFKQSRGVLGIVGPQNELSLTEVTAVNGRSVKGIQEAKRAILAAMGAPMTLSVPTSTDEDAALYVNPSKELNTALMADDTVTLALYDLDERNVFIKHGFLSAIGEAFKETGSVVTNTFEALGQMVTGVRSAEELGGIIRIGAIAGDAAQAGLIALIAFTALLSINLGLINLFPIPVLDGGHLLFYAIEAVKGSPISEKTQNYAFRFGLFLLIGLMLFANLNDLIQLGR